MSLSNVSAHSVQVHRYLNVFAFFRKNLNGTLQLAGGLLCPVLLLGLWYVATVKQWLPEQILPPPALVWRGTVGLWEQGALQFRVQASAKRILWSVLLGASVGIVVAAWLALMVRGRDCVFPSITLVAQCPMVGWIPLLMIF